MRCTRTAPPSGNHCANTPRSVSCTTPARDERLLLLRQLRAHAVAEHAGRRAELRAQRDLDRALDVHRAVRVEARPAPASPSTSPRPYASGSGYCTTSAGLQRAERRAHVGAARSPRRRSAARRATPGTGSCRPAPTRRARDRRCGTSRAARCRASVRTCPAAPRSIVTVYAVFGASSDALTLTSLSMAANGVVPLARRRARARARRATSDRSAW